MQREHTVNRMSSSLRKLGHSATLPYQISSSHTDGKNSKVRFSLTRVRQNKCTKRKSHPVLITATIAETLAISSRPQSIQLTLKCRIKHSKNNTDIKQLLQGSIKYGHTRITALERPVAQNFTSLKGLLRLVNVN